MPNPWTELFKEFNNGVKKIVDLVTATYGSRRIQYNAHDDSTFIQGTFKADELVIISKVAKDISKKAEELNKKEGDKNE
jgi:predicted nucleic acid-binding protein